MNNPDGPRVLINGMSIGTGGGYTVGRELARYIALARPDWRLTLAVIKGHRLQSEFANETTLPENLELFWTPESNIDPRRRLGYEKGELVPWANREGFRGIVQLNGMVLPGAAAPTLAHFQDPFPYRPEAWDTLKERFAAWFKRRANRRALREAAVCGWTSHYLEELICGAHGVRPKKSIVFYNGVPDEWVERAAGTLPPWDTRPMKLVTVSNVWPYKRQSLVIEALARLRKTPELADLEYHVLGAGSEEYYQELRDLASRLGIGDAVHVEGRVPDARVEEAMRFARAMPLMSVCESFGIPTIEAMASGTPVVVADCCALPEVCGEAAVVTPVDDVEALANSLHSLLTDPARVERLRALGAERVAAFQWRAIGERMADAIDEMMAV